MSLTFPVDGKLKDGSPVQLVLADERDVEPLRGLYRMIVEEGTSYPHDRFPDEDDFMDYWFRGKSTVAAYVPDRAGAAGMVGAFYLKPNWPGRAGHVANAGFIVAPDWRSKGQPAIFMTVRREIAQSPRETGARSREEGKHT